PRSSNCQMILFVHDSVYLSFRVFRVFRGGIPVFGRFEFLGDPVHLWLRLRCSGSIRVYPWLTHSALIREIRVSPLCSLCFPFILHPFFTVPFITHNSSFILSLEPHPSYFAPTLLRSHALDLSQTYVKRR